VDERADRIRGERVAAGAASTSPQGGGAELPGFGSPNLPAQPETVPVVADRGRETAGDAVVAEVAASPTSPAGASDAPRPAVGEARVPERSASPTNPRRRRDSQPSDVPTEQAEKVSSGGAEQETFWTMVARRGNYILDLKPRETPAMLAGRIEFLISTSPHQSALTRFRDENSATIDALPEVHRNDIDRAHRRQMRELDPRSRK